jgi:hypothetical protein
MTTLAPPLTNSDDDRAVVIMPWIAQDIAGHDPRSHYVEHYWLGIIGPTSVLLLRRIADVFDHYPDGFEIDLSELAASLGVGGGGRHSSMQRTLVRCTQFGLARMEGPGVYVRRTIPPLSPRQVARLPRSVQLAHAEFVQTCS